MNEERNAAMAEMARDGKTLTEIGERFGLTRERVRQIMARFPDVPDTLTRNEMRRFEERGRFCEVCGAGFVPAPARAGRFCSPRCHGVSSRRFPPAVERGIVARVRVGETQFAVAADLGVSVMTVSAICRRHGLRLGKGAPGRTRPAWHEGRAA